MFLLFGWLDLHSGVLSYVAWLKALNEKVFLVDAFFASKLSYSVRHMLTDAPEV